MLLKFSVLNKKKLLCPEAQRRNLTNMKRYYKFRGLFPPTTGNFVAVRCIINWLSVCSSFEMSYRLLSWFITDDIWNNDRERERERESGGGSWHEPLATGGSREMLLVGIYWFHCMQSYHLLLPYGLYKQTKLNSMVCVHERTIPTERPPLVGEMIANFCG
jgi:hypothetical protein